MSQIQPGSSVESQCKKCKTVTDHYVVVMDGEKIAKVECKVCGGRHVCKPPQAAQAAIRMREALKTPRSVVPPKRQSSTVRALWEQAVADASPIPYAMTGLYRATDIIDHPVFGLGAVQKFMRPNTIEVLFEDGVRNLRCGGTHA